MRHAEVREELNKAYIHSLPCNKQPGNKTPHANANDLVLGF